MFYDIFCYIYENNTKLITSCNLKEYSNSLFKKISTQSCNVTYESVSQDNLIEVEAFNQTDFDKISRELIVKKNIEKQSWCGVYDFAHFLWDKIYENWCTIVDCTKKENMQIKHEIEMVPNESKQSLLNWLFGIKTNYISTNNLRFLATGCMVGGVMASIYLVYAKKSSKPQGPKSEDISYLSPEETQKLIELVEIINDEYNKLKSKVDQDQSQSSATIEDLQLRLNQLCNESVLRENKNEDKFSQQLVINRKLEEYACNLKQKCTNYEKKIEELQKELEKYKESFNNEKQIYKVIVEERDNIQKKLDVYETDIEKLKCEISKIKSAPEEVYKVSQNGNTTKHTKKSKHVVDDTFIAKSLSEIERIWKATEKLENEIDKFSGKKSDRDFAHLKEMLIRNSVELDNVESEGHLIIRNRRREALAYVNDCLNLLKIKAREE